MTNFVDHTRLPNWWKEKKTTSLFTESPKIDDKVILETSALR